MKGIKKRLATITCGALMVGFLSSVGGCASPRLGFVKFSEDIQSPDPCIRVRASIYAGNLKDKRAIPLLVDRLDDEDEAVRMSANESLKQITGKDFGYRSYDSPGLRAVAVDQWRQWMSTSTQPVQTKNKE